MGEVSLTEVEMTSAVKPSTRRPSTFRRLSRFLPQLSTETKVQEIPPLPMPSKHLSPHLLEVRSPRHPTRPPPPSPRLDGSPGNSPLQVKKLRKHNTPSPSASTPSSTFSGEQTAARVSPTSPHVTTDFIEQPSVPRILYTPNGAYGDIEKETSRAKLRKSWLPGSRSRSSRNTNSGSGHEPQAWVNVGAARIEYDLAPLLQAEKVLELWNNAGEIYVHLWPQESVYSAQFRVPYIVIESSMKLRNLIRDSQLLNQESSVSQLNTAPEESTSNLEPDRTGSRACSPNHSLSDKNSLSDSSDDLLMKPRRHHLYFPLDVKSFESPLSNEDIQKLVDVRNLFAFLTRQPLVATRLRPTYFQIFLSIAALLKDFEFSSEDTCSFGPAVDMAFSFCLKEIPQIADCRESNQVTIEALILAEAMKSAELYNEAFAHTVGKYDSITSSKSGNLLNSVSSSTRDRLGKASRELKQRIRSVNDRLSDFEFPSLFAGIAASTSAEEAKLVRFKQWRLSFLVFRKQVISYYKELHGQWPPKATSKKNNFVACGLNRLVIKGLYNDLCDLYDFLTDRECLTTRVYNGDGLEEPPFVTPAARALRKLLDEYDRSSPPVQPPIPFDIPLVPSIRSIDPKFQSLGPMDQHKKQNQRLSENEAALILIKSHNLEYDYKTPFIEMFKSFELKEAKGKTASELSEQRHGYWIFLYACLQTLPLLITDAPGLQYVDGVEHFLCQIPLGNLPWVEDQSQIKMSWFEVQGGQQIVSLPSDVVNYGIEAIYSRSHCWAVAEKWIESEQNSSQSNTPVGEEFSPLSPPPGFDRSVFGLPGSEHRSRRSSAETASQCSSQMSNYSRSHHRGRRTNQRSSIALGLEKVRIEQDETTTTGSIFRGISPISLHHNTQSRPVSRAQSRCRDFSRDFGSSTFDDILGNMSAEKEATKTKDTKKKKKQK
ncbi:putative choriogenin hminor [Erysiphe neolycopersici]|uniref:Putative choriogenin hminor n=1 Tax=Erysiphe neolycopersici TaxID=212602 RepID=A0A420H748_9PEZI|nr:putative choriogenin hminor [Erysiphe neolycopersici]